MKPNQSAFPRVVNNGIQIQVSNGITQRDHIAICAMQGLISDPSYRELYPHNSELCTMIAKKSFAIADAMIAESENPQ